MTQTQTTKQMSVSPKKRGANEEVSPRKRQRVDGLPPLSPFKRPVKVVNGSLGQAEKALSRSGIMQDIVNGI